MHGSSHCGAQGSQNSNSYEFSPSSSFWNLTIHHLSKFIGHLKWSRNWTVAFSGSLLPWVPASVIPPHSLRSWECCSVTFSMTNFGWVKSSILFAFMPMILLREINNSRLMMATSEGLSNFLLVHHFCSLCQIPEACYGEMQWKGREETNPGTSPGLREKRIQIFYVEQIKWGILFHFSWMLRVGTLNCFFWILH